MNHSPKIELIWLSWDWTELKTANVLNKFFSNIITSLEIGQYSNYDPQIDDSEELFLTTRITLVVSQFKKNSRTT